MVNWSLFPSVKRVPRDQCWPLQTPEYNLGPKVPCSTSPSWRETTSLPRQNEEDDILRIEVEVLALLLNVWSQVFARGSKETVLVGVAKLKLPQYKQVK